MIQSYVEAYGDDYINLTKNFIGDGELIEATTFLSELYKRDVLRKTYKDYLKCQVFTM